MASTRTISTGPAVLATAGVPIVVGSVVLAMSPWPTMNANNAASFVLVGVAVGLLTAGRRVPTALGRAIGPVVAGSGLASVTERGWPSVATAFAFVCLGLALVFWGATRRWARDTMWALVGLVALTAFNGLLSHLYGIEPSGPFSTMGMPTAATLLAVALGIMLAHPDHGPVGALTSRFSGGMSARRLLPVAILGPAAGGLLALEGNRLNWYESDFRLTVVVTYAVAMVTAVVLAKAARLDRSDAQRAKADTDRALATALADEAYRALEGTNERLAAANDRLAATNERLEAANKELEAFSYSVSHDLRAPLRAIDGFSRILVEEHASALPEDARGYLIRVRAGAQRMGQLIDDLLAFAYLGRQTMTEQEVKPAEIAERALSGLRHQCEGRNVKVHIADLPPCVADPALLEQVYANLLSNALKFTRDRDPARVEVDWRQENGHVAYTVSDNGAGFDEQYAHKLFGVFQRLHKTEEFEGTGVGLALVQRIINRHGGRIWATSKPDQGATFTFTLPDGPP